jgi:hypothetical protein
MKYMVFNMINNIYIYIYIGIGISDCFDFNKFNKYMSMCWLY